MEQSSIPEIQHFKSDQQEFIFNLAKLQQEFEILNHILKDERYFCCKHILQQALVSDSFAQFYSIWDSELTYKQKRCQQFRKIYDQVLEIHGDLEEYEEKAHALNNLLEEHSEAFQGKCRDLANLVLRTFENARVDEISVAEVAKLIEFQNNFIIPQTKFLDSEWKERKFHSRLKASVESLRSKVLRNNRS